MGCCFSKPDPPELYSTPTNNQEGVNEEVKEADWMEGKQTNIPEVQGGINTVPDADELSSKGSLVESRQLCDLCASGSFGDHLWFYKALRTPTTWIDEHGTYTASVAEMDEAEKSNPSHVYNTTTDMLEAAAKSGCPWCTHIFAQIAQSGRSIIPLNPSRKTEDEFIRIRVNVSLSEPNDTPSGLQKLRLAVTQVKDGHPWVTSNSAFLLYAESDDPAADVVVARPMIRDVASSKAVQSAVKCISQCQQGHERCRHLGDKVPSLPTRVIDCLDPSHPQLVSTNKEKAWYTTLSYCWGEPQPYQTRLSNIAAYHEGLDITHFPQTIKDAILTTHALGIRYVWIDSLCIIQDSAEDKIQELGDMARIYADAYLTIIAASAQKVSDGFLQVRTAGDDVQPDIPVRFPCPDGAGIGTVYLYSPDTYMPQHADGKDPIDQRAWCFQERLVSPRSLIYTSETLEYHCLTSMVAVGDAALPYTPAQRLPDVLFTPNQYLPPQFTREEWAAFRAAWKSGLLQYMRRGITNPDDKLVAMSSVGERFQRVFKAEYLAGLWRDTLVDDLCWFVFSGGSDRPSSYRAPSWSWAAVDHGIMTDWHLIPEEHSKETETCEVVSCEVTLKHKSLPFGEVTSGTLVLHAPLFKAYRHWELPPWAQVYLPGYDNSADPGHPAKSYRADGPLGMDDSDASSAEESRSGRQTPAIEDDDDQSEDSLPWPSLEGSVGPLNGPPGLISSRGQGHPSGSSDGSSDGSDESAVSGPLPGAMPGDGIPDHVSSPPLSHANECLIIDLLS
ncbi:hypothetical protein ONZ45_g658 [Pleurotus djamor]|nr:hypothetical protein ONZ45_g658 [Pleurotus djamor]